MCIVWTDTLDQLLIRYANKYNYECCKIREAMGFTPEQDQQIKDRYKYLKQHYQPPDKNLDFIPQKDPNYLSMLVSHAYHEKSHWKEKAQIASELFSRTLDELEGHIKSKDFNEFCNNDLCGVTSDKDIEAMANKNINRK